VEVRGRTVASLERDVRHGNFVRRDPVHGPSLPVRGTGSGACHETTMTVTGGHRDDSLRNTLTLCTHISALCSSANVFSGARRLYIVDAFEAVRRQLGPVLNDRTTRREGAGVSPNSKA
jgi:hypothetical protein